MTTYAAIPDAEIDPNKPALSSTMVKMRDNPLAVVQGDPTAIAAGLGVYVDKSGQMALLTDETDTDKVLTPDGAGSARWVGTGVAKGGTGKDGVVTGITIGCYEAQSVNITTAQTPTGTVIIRSTGAVSISGTITSSFPVIIRCSSSSGVTITATIACAGLIIDSVGGVTINQAVTSAAGDVVIRGAGNVTVASVTCQRFGAQSLNGTVAITGTITSKNVDNGPRPGASETGVGKGAGGGGGGHAGGPGGAGNDGTYAGGAGSKWLGAVRAYLREVDQMSLGSAGGDSDGSGRPLGGAAIAIASPGNITVSGSLLAAGEDGTGTGSINEGGGGGGWVRIFCGGTLTYSGSPTVSAKGGEGGNGDDDGGGGGGGMVAEIYDAISGSRTVTVAGGGSVSGTPGTAGTSYATTMTAAEAQEVIDSFGSVAPWIESNDPELED